MKRGVERVQAPGFMIERKSIVRGWECASFTNGAPDVFATWQEAAKVLAENFTESELNGDEEMRVHATGDMLPGMLYCGVFVMTDQPETCPYCGSRSDLVTDTPFDGGQFHACEPCQSLWTLTDDSDKPGRVS